MSLHVIDFNEAAKIAPKGPDFFQAFTKALTPFGLTDLSYGAIGPMKFVTEIQPKDLFFSTYSRAMLQQLGGMAGFVDDLARVRAGQWRDTLWTDDAIWSDATPLQQQQYRLEYDAGPRNGYTHALGKLGQMTVSIGLRMDGLSGAEFDRHWPEVSAIILPMVQVMHCHFVKDHLPAHYALSQREVDVLSWLAMGLRPDEIADQLTVGYRTIDKYIVAAKEKLGANSRDHAVARALSLGLLPI